MTLRNSTVNFFGRVVKDSMEKVDVPSPTQISSQEVYDQDGP